MKRLMGLISTNFESEAFGELIKDRSVASVPFGGRYRLIDFPLSNMVNSGITTVGFITPNSFRSLMDHVGVGKEWSLDRKIGGMFILPGSTYGMKNNRGKFLLRDIISNKIYFERSQLDNVVLTGTNKIMNIDYKKIAKAHEASEADITLVYKKGMVPVEGDEDYLVIEDGIVKSIEDKADFNANLFLDTIIIGRELLMKFLGWYERLSSLDFVDAIKDNLDSLKVCAYEFTGYVGAINGVSTYTEVSRDILKPAVHKELFNVERPISTKVTDAPPAKYAPGAQVKNSLVASGGILKGKVEGSIIFRGVEVEEGAEVKNCIIMQDCVIKKGAKLENVICDRKATISEDIQLIGKAETPIVVSKNQKL